MSAVLAWFELESFDQLDAFKKLADEYAFVYEGCGQDKRTGEYEAFVTCPSKIKLDAFTKKLVHAQLGDLIGYTT